MCGCASPNARRASSSAPTGHSRLLGLPELSGLAWNATHGELVLATNSERRIESNTVRLGIAALEPERLELAGDDPTFSGEFRRGQAAHVRGVVTYREGLALDPDARVTLELTQIGVGPAALHVFQPRDAVPIHFDLSVPAAATGARFELRARIGDRERTLFATPEPVPVTPGGDEAEVVLRSAR